jgi:hypothetical protein
MTGDLIHKKIMVKLKYFRSFLQKLGVWINATFTIAGGLLDIAELRGASNVHRGAASFCCCLFT